MTPALISKANIFFSCLPIRVKNLASMALCKQTLPDTNHENVSVAQAVVLINILSAPHVPQVPSRSADPGDWFWLENMSLGAEGHFQVETRKRTMCSAPCFLCSLWRNQKRGAACVLESRHRRNLSWKVPQTLGGLSKRETFAVLRHWSSRLVVTTA